MINKNILIIASNIKNYGLSGKFTHYISMKSKKCGDTIKIELTKKDNKIQSMRYETESCIFCQATASLLSRKINLFKIKTLEKDINILINTIKFKNDNLPLRLKIFDNIVNHQNISRLECITLPFIALKKALKL